MFTDKSASSRQAWRYALSIAFIACIHTSAFTQITRYKATRFQESDGLPSSRIHRLLADRFGYIWVGTINGLARYDGYGFKRFYTNPNEPNSINGLIIWNIFEDREGLIWVSAGVEHLNAYDYKLGGFRHYQYQHMVKRPANIEVGIDAISQDKKGRLYFGISTMFGETIDEGLLYKDPGSDSLHVFRQAGGLAVQNVNRLATDSSGVTWIMATNGLFCIDTAGRLAQIRQANDIPLEENESGNDMQVDRDGNLWALTSLGNIVGYSPADDRFALYKNPFRMEWGPLPSQIMLQGDDEILIAHSSGFIVFNRHTRKFEQYPRELLTGKDIPNMDAIIRDPFGAIWLGSSTWGLFKMEEKASFSSFTPNSPPPATTGTGWASKIKEGPDGMILFTSNSDGNNELATLNRLDIRSGSVKQYKYESILPGLLHISAFDFLPGGQILLGTNIGLYRYSPEQGVAKPEKITGYPGQTLANFFLTDSRNIQWIGTYAGVYRKRPGENAYTKVDLSGLPGYNASSDEVSFLLESKRHGLWIVSNNGLFLYNYEKNSVERHGFDPSKGQVFLTQDVNAVYEDPEDGTVWVGSWQGGLHRYDLKTGLVKNFNLDNGLPSMSIQGILGDEKTRTLWLSTFDGLCRFDPQSGQSNNYTINDGIQGFLFADAACLRTKSGHFVFGGSNGLTLFLPGQISRQTSAPRVYLTGIRLFNKTLVPEAGGILKKLAYETSEINLSHNQHTLTFEFVALHYGNPAKNRYLYKLENHDPDWREAQGRPEAFYTRLPPGKYVFRVKAANSNGIWNEEGVRLAVTVFPPWWQTPWAYALYAMGAIGLGFLVNNVMRRRLLAKEKEKQRELELSHAREIEKAYRKLEETHETLKQTQSQLIQSEKMASLGELTAGIAHEIQNPLNFVNNFAEVNQELLQEMQEAIAKGDTEEVKAIASDVIDNEGKIAFHGKRADAIVKNMLQHSRAAVGEKEPTDLNALADEYLRLSYHGLRAKDKTFNAALKTDFDPQLPLVPVVNQDISRVLLNLINNAFYAVRERKKSAGPGYEPTVTVGTRMHDAATVVLSVQDNGIGIPEAVREKIFQPFFTTKPTGEGTGLGLSLSYDIVKAHGGEIQVDSKPGGYTWFMVMLPVT